MSYDPPIEPPYTCQEGEDYMREAHSLAASDCSAFVQCTFTYGGERCGDIKGHSGAHTTNVPSIRYPWHPIHKQNNPD